MKAQKVIFYSKLPSLGGSAAPVEQDSPARIEPSTCTEAETFVLRVLDDSMQPEFRRGCIIVIDPTGIARNGSYVLARSVVEQGSVREETDGYVFRQLQQRTAEHWELTALNEQYPSEPTPDDLSAIVGVIVQRAGTRRRYHKHYD